MKQCPYCGAMLADNATFCNRCGNNLAQNYQQSYPQQNRQAAQYSVQNQYPQQTIQQVQYSQQLPQGQFGQQMLTNSQVVPADYVPKSAKTARTLGILSLLLLPVLSIPALIYASKSKDETGGVMCKTAKRGQWCAIVALVVFAVSVASVYLTTSGESCVPSNDSFCISCAKQLVSENLKSPSTAKFYDVEVEDKDDYGRVLISLTVEAQNSFGAYLRSYYIVVIYDVDAVEGTFRYNRIAGVVNYDSPSEHDFCVNAVKLGNNWGEPMDESDLSD